VVMYFENVSIKRTARCSSSLHYPAAGRMPETQSHWRDILLSWNIGSDMTFAKSEWLRWNAI